MFSDLVTSLRVVVVSLLVCAATYPAVLLAIGQLAAPERANGSLLRADDGEIVGSRLIAQPFTRPEYLWPRPSAVAYNGAAAGGSNLAASNPALRARGEETVARWDATPGRPLPGELAETSGSGLDPHLTLAGALYQAARIAAARGVNVTRVEEVIHEEASRATPWSPRLVNVLEANLSLDRHLGLLSSQ